MATIQAILSLRAQRWSYRRIARELGIHRETVARYVLAAESKPAQAPTGAKPTKHNSENNTPAVETAAITN